MLREEFDRERETRESSHLPSSHAPTGREIRILEKPVAFYYAL